MKRKKYDVKLIGLISLAILFVGVSTISIFEARAIKAYKLETKNLEIKKRKVQTLNSTNQKLNDQLSNLQVKYNDAEKKLEQSQVNQNNNVESPNYHEFTDITKKAFTGLYEFNPKNFKQRKQILTPFLSENLINQYFNDSDSNVGDANGTTSKVDSLDIYTKAVQGTSIDGLVVVNYQSKIGDQKFSKSTDMYQITYNTETKKIETIQKLGTGMKGDNIE